MERRKEDRENDDFCKRSIDKEEKAKSIRSPGWRGSRLSVKTREGKDLAVEYSNQVHGVTREVKSSHSKE